MKTIIFWAVCCLFATHTFAQAPVAVSVSGKIQDGKGASLPFANVTLHRAADSIFVKAAVSDEGGWFELDAWAEREEPYFVKISLLGFAPVHTPVFNLGPAHTTHSLGELRLSPANNTLQEVTVTAMKPFIERRTDRLIVNVENSIVGAGSSAMEVLERSPGVIIGQNDAVSLRGKSGVIVMIDGKPSPMSGQDLANYLRALPSNSIERIEIITNPSAKYDAAGNAGIIDIRLKKDKRLGTNGTFSTNYGQGVYPKAGAGLSLNHRDKTLNFFGSYNYSFRKGFNDLRLYRAFFENQQPTGAYDQFNYLVMPFHYHAVRTGVDYFSPNKKTTLGLVASGSVNRFKPNGQNISDVENGAGEKESAFGTTNRSSDVWPTYAFNANVKHTFDEKGREISADLDYARYWNETEQNFTTDYYGLNGEQILPTYLLFGDLQGNLQIRSAKADYVNPLPNNAKWEAGWKSSIVDADNNLQFFDKSDGVAVYDSSISNHFIYRENINAAYLNYSREWEKFSLQAGLRTEQTVAKGEQLVNGESFDRNYLNWFPSAFFNYKFSEKYEMGLNMSRRLDRPTYSQLNPFKFFLDPSTYRAGNPFLNPQFTWSFDWNHTIAQRYTATLNYSFTLDNITQVIGPVEGFDRVTVQTDKNLARFDYYGLALSAPVDIAPWWNSVNNLNVWYGHYSGNLANTNLSDGNVVLHYSTNNTFSLKNNWSAELNLMYITPQLYGYMNLDPMWGLGVGIQKHLFERRATLKFSVTDIFWTNLSSAVIRFRDYVETFDVKRDTRVASLTFSYRFGNNQVAPSRRRAGGAEEEKRRASSGQG